MPEEKKEEEKKEEPKEVDILGELDAMTKSLGANLTTEKAEEPKPEKKDEKPESKKEEVKDEPESKPEEKADEPESEPDADEKEEEPPLDEKDKLIAELRKKLAEKEAAPKDVKKEEPKPEVKPESKKEEPLVLPEQDFTKDIDIDDVSRDPVALNKLLNKVRQQAIEDARKIITEGILTSIPEMVRTNIAITQRIQEIGKKFYEENPDLASFKKVVAAVWEEVASASPDATVDETIKKVAADVRQRLGLMKKAADADKSTSPKLPKKGGGTGRTHEKPDVTPLQAELEEMTKTVRR